MVATSTGELFGTKADPAMEEKKEEKTFVTAANQYLAQEQNSSFANIQRGCRLVLEGNIK